MIRFSNYGDLNDIKKMFNKMSIEDKKNLFYGHSRSYVNFVELQNDIIKGKCLMFKKNNTTIGYLATSLENIECVFITELYIAPKYRVGSLSTLKEVIDFIKTYYDRPIKFVIHKDNEKMKKIAKFIKAKELSLKNDIIEYVIENERN